MRSNDFMRMEQGLTLNLLEIVFNKNTLSLRKATYSDELYNEYRRNPDFFIYRFKDSLYIWELHPTDESLPKTFQETEVTIEEHAPIYRKIVEYAIAEFFINNNRQVFRKPYSLIWEVELKRENQKNFGALSFCPTLAFSLHNFRPKLNSKPLIALSLRRRMKPVFNENDETGRNQPVNIQGLTRNDQGKITTSIENQYRYLESIDQKQTYLNYQKTMKFPKNESNFFEKYTESFKQITPKLYMPNGLQISKFLPVKLPHTSFDKSTKINRPQYFYYNERTKTGYSNKVVSELGPSSLDIFKNQKLDILVVSPDKYDRTICKYTKRLDRKLQSLFHLKDVKFHLKTIKSTETYLTILNKIDANDYNLAIIVVSDRDKEIPTLESPYYLTKAKLLNQRLLTQELTIEVISNSTEIIENDIALNVYSKLGGTAWTIGQSEKNISELIIGIGSTVDDNGERIIGFASVFDYNGTYIVGDCSQLSTMNEYVKNLEDYLVDTLTQAFQKKGLSRGNRIRLIFHLFKEAGKKHELTAIENALKRFREYNVEYSLVHLSYGHNFLVFKNQGRDRPNRGTFVPISLYQALLHLGANTVAPIQVRLDKRSTYKNMYEITQQVLYFSHLSYRSFIDSKRPVTVKYPSLMANMVSELKKVSNWDYAILNKLNELPWFI